MKYIGIDPGKDGGIAVIEDNKLTTYIIPRLKKGVVDEEQLDKLLFELKYHPDWEDMNPQDCMCVLENVHSVHRSSANSNFQFGDINGLIRGMLISNRIPFIRIEPKEWQKEAWRGVSPIKINTGEKLKSGEPKYKIDTKATSLIAAKRLFPNETFLATERSKVPHDGLVDAALMAFYCKMKY